MKTNTRHGAYRLPAGIWPVVLAAVMLIAPGAVRANTVSAFDAAWPAFPDAQTVDVSGVATNASGRGVRDRRQIRQTFQAAQEFDLKYLYLSVTYRDDADFNLRIFQVDDIVLRNLTPHPVHLTPYAHDGEIHSRGPLIDQGERNQSQRLAEP